jgi:hypothetical protein
MRYGNVWGWARQQRAAVGHLATRWGRRHSCAGCQASGEVRCRRRSPAPPARTDRTSPQTSPLRRCRAGIVGNRSARLSPPTPPNSPLPPFRSVRGPKLYHPRPSRRIRPAPGSGRANTGFTRSPPGCSPCWWCIPSDDHARRVERGTSAASMGVADDEPDRDRRDPFSFGMDDHLADR